MRKGLWKFLMVLLCIAILAVLPLAGMFAYAWNQPATYKESYYAALPLKYDRLKSVKEEKIVVIGGSSTAFGIDSKIVEEELGMPCVNFGLYAALGFKPMLDLSLKEIQKGDIVILAPEISAQMFSDYVGYEFLLQAIEERPDMAYALGHDYTKGFLANFRGYVKDAKKLRQNGGFVANSIYALSSFDDYGDIVYERPENVMDTMYSMDNLPELCPDIVTDSFAGMVNEYVQKVQKKGANVYFSFCPVNAMSAEQIPDSDKKGFVEALEEKLDCEVIGSLEDHLMDAGYFYDSNFHTNDSGCVYNTVLLVNDIKRVTGKMTVTQTKLPEPPAAGDNAVIASGSDELFTYDVTAAGVVITGLTEEGKKKESLEVPKVEDNYTVYKIGPMAFTGAKAKEIILPSTISSLGSSPFSDADELEVVFLRSQNLPEIGSGLLKDANDKLVIKVPKDLYGNYVTDYFWGEFASSIEEE